MSRVMGLKRTFHDFQSYSMATETPADSHTASLSSSSSASASASASAQSSSALSSQHEDRIHEDSSSFSFSPESPSRETSTPAPIIPSASPHFSFGSSNSTVLPSFSSSFSLPSSSTFSPFGAPSTSASSSLAGPFSSSLAHPLSPSSSYSFSFVSAPSSSPSSSSSSSTSSRLSILPSSSHSTKRLRRGADAQQPQIYVSTGSADASIHSSGRGNDEDDADQEPCVFPGHEIDARSYITDSHIRRARRGPAAGEGGYSFEQVREILQEALRKQEEQLREEYELKLAELLREQFEEFSRFNKDYVSRQLARSDLPSYIN